MCFGSLLHLFHLSMFLFILWPVPTLSDLVKKLMWLLNFKREESGFLDLI